MLNLLKILKNAPKGTKLYSPLVGEVYLEKIFPRSLFPVMVKDETGKEFTFKKDGHYYSNTPNGECLLFPSKEHRTWDNWQSVLFKAGDYIIGLEAVYKILNIYDNGIDVKASDGKTYFLSIDRTKFIRYASKEEIKKYNTTDEKWNPHTLQPFDSVLVRDSEDYQWQCNIFSYLEDNEYYPFKCIYSKWRHCVPFNEETKHLLGNYSMPPAKYVS